MTKEEIMAMNMEQLEERRSAIVSEIETAEADALDSLSAELDAIEERKSGLKRIADEKRAEMLEVIKGDGEPIEETKEERKTMEKVEVRSTTEYLTAWVSDALGKANPEQRALLTENATNGTVAVPTYVDDTIHTAWESNEILRRMKRTYFSGNLKVGYESTASAAAVHTEGSGEVPEEELTLGIVTLIPKMVKKWVSYSDEAADINESFARYIIDEITDKIIKGLIGEALDAMAASALTEPASLVGDGLVIADVINAEGKLGGEASNPVIITTRQSATNLRLAALSMQYAVDPFDGMEVLYADEMPAIEGAGAVEAFIADLSGVQVNFPNGDDVKIKVDDITLATSDMVRVIGRLYAAVDVVAPKKVVAITSGGK